MADTRSSGLGASPRHEPAGTKRPRLATKRLELAERQEPKRLELADWLSPKRRIRNLWFDKPLVFNWPTVKPAARKRSLG